MAENRVNITVTASGAAEAQKVLTAVATAGGQIGTVGAPGIKRAEDALNSLGSSAKRVFEIFTGFTAANLFAQAITQTKAFTVEVAKLGLEAKVQEDAFARLSKSVGVAGDALVAQMNKAAGGILNTSDVMIAAAKALNQSLQPEQIVKLMEIARQQSKLAGIDVADAFNKITEAIANQQPKALKQLGIVIDMDAAFKKHASTLGVEVEQLTELGKTQAIYNAVADQTANSVRALTSEALTQSEQIQQLSAAWKQAKEDIGKVLVDVGFAVLAWLRSVAATLPEMSQQLAQFGVIWKSVWTGAAAVVEPVVRILVDVFLPTLKIAGVAATAFGVGMNAGFSVIAGPLAYVASIIDDLARNKWPSHTRATLEANAATAEARVRLAESVTAMGNLAAGTTATSAATKEMATSTAMGTNSLAGMSGQVKALVPDLKALAAEAQKAALAMMKLTLGDAAEALREAQLLLDLKDVDDALKDLSLTLGANADAVRKDADAWREEAAAAELAAEALKQIAPLAATIEAAFDVGGERLTEQLIGVNRELRALKATSDLDAESLRMFGVSFALLDEKTQESLLSLRAWRGEVEQLDAAKQYAATLADIGTQAALLGSSFDPLPPTIAAVTAEILRLGKAGQDVTALQEKLAGLKQVQELKGIFADVFSSIGSAISTSIQGVILGTQTMAQAWDKLWKSIVLSFLNSGVQRVLKGLQDWALDFFFGKSSSGGGGGGGVLGALLGGGGGGARPGGGGGSPFFDPTGQELPGAGGFNSVMSSTVDTIGTFNSGLQLANTGMSSFSSGLGTISSIGAGLWGAVGGAGGALGPAFTGVGAVDVALAGGSFLDVAGAANAAIGPISSLTVGLAGVGAAVAVFGTVMDFVNGQTEAAIGGVVGGVTGAVAGGLIGTYLLPGIGTVLGALAGGALGDWIGSMIGGLFGGPSNYELKRIKAADEASAFVGGTGQSYQTALNSGNVAQILAALQGIGTGANPLRTELVLTSTLAEQLGLKGEREGDNVIIQWAQVTEQQLGELIALFKASPEMVPGAIRGGGDIAYLTPDKVKPYADALEQGAEGLLAGFSALEAVKDKINTLAKDLADAAKESLPPGLAQEFADGIVNPIRDRMLAVITSGLPAAEMQKQLDAMTVELQGKVEAWNMFAVAIKQATVVDALIPANLHTQFRAAMEPAYDAMLDAMRTGTAAQAKLQADHFAKLTQGWAAFSDAVEAQVGVEMLLEPIADLGERFSAAMQPIYDKILASLVAGNGAIALAQTQTFARLTQAWATLGAATQQAIDVDALLPDDLGDRFRAKMQPEYDKILATLVAGNAEVAAALLTAFNKQLAAWASIGQTVTRITGELAGLTGTLDGSVETWVAVQRQMDTAVTRAQEAFDKALASGDVQRIATTAATLHDATMARLQAEMEMVKQIEAAITATLQAASGLVALVTTIALLEIEMSGSIGTVQALLGALEGMATGGATVAQRMWAVAAAIDAIVAVLPGLIEQFASFSTALEWLTRGMQTAEQLRSGPGGPGAITGAVIAGAAPFLAAQQAEIDAAKGPARLALLQQQGATLQQLATAAIAGVKQWAQAAIAGARAAADEVIKGARAEADRRMDVARTEAARRQALIDAARDQALAAIDAEIKAAETAARLGQEARRAQIEAVQELLAASKELESAIESMGKFIQSLKVGPLGPGNPMDKLMQAQDAFAKALQAYNANPTAGGLTDLQGLAQTMLGLAEPIFSKPSPQFQALSATTLKQLEAAQAVAAAQVTDSEVLQAQLDTLIAMDKAATLAAAAQLDALRANREAIVKDFEKQTKDLSDALDKYLGETEAALKTYIDEVETALTTQTLAIEKAAKDEIDAINVGLIGALNANAFAQAGLVGEQNEKIDTLIEALTSTEYEGVRLGDIAVYAARRQDDAILILEAIKRGIGLAVGQPLARGSERVTEGLYHLHDDEAVLPRALAERFRAAGGFDQMIRSAAEGAGMTDPYGDLQYDPTGRYKPSLGNLAPAFLFAGPRADELNQIQAISEMLESRLQADLVRNTYRRGGKIHQRRTESEIEALKAKVAQQVADLRGQQSAIIASTPIPTSPTTPRPPTPAAPPPYVPPGPAWLTRDGGAPDGGATTIIVKLDGKTIGEATLPTIHSDARGGKLRTIFLETRRK